MTKKLEDLFDLADMESDAEIEIKLVLTLKLVSNSYKNWTPR